jgi:hypothetical protein
MSLKLGLSIAFGNASGEMLRPSFVWQFAATVLIVLSVNSTMDLPASIMGVQHWHGGAAKAGQGVFVASRRDPE